MPAGFCLMCWMQCCDCVQSDLESGFCLLSGEWEHLGSREKRDGHFVLRNMEKILTLPRRMLLKVRLAGEAMRTEGGLGGASTRELAGHSMTRILFESREIDLTSFRFRVVTRDIMLAATGMHAVDMRTADSTVGAGSWITMRAEACREKHAVGWRRAEGETWRAEGGK